MLLAFFTTLVASLAVLVHTAQADIDRRTRIISRLQQRLERLVSRQAVSAVHAAGESLGLPTQVLDLTLFYSDARDFTGFSERHAPEEVIGALNRLMALQVEIIQKLGGDVDKMIGDAMFARFDNTGRERRALEAAAAVQSALDGEDGLPFGVGIGVYSGRVVAGSIGVCRRGGGWGCAYTIAASAWMSFSMRQQLAITVGVSPELDSRQEQPDAPATACARQVAGVGP